MRGRTTKLVLALFAAGALSFLAGLIFMETVGAIPCEGEGLACNIDAAVGGYGVLIFAVLGPTIYGVTLLVAPNRTAVVGALGVLLCRSSASTCSRCRTTGAISASIPIRACALFSRWRPRRL
ncbi:MAG: hypothetical protein WA717_10195 [Methyloceanibacter sp.]